MKNILIYPPLSHPAYIYLSVPLLLGQVQSLGIECAGNDLNVEYFNHIFTKKYLEGALIKLKNYENNSAEFSEKPYYKDKVAKIKSYLSENIDRAEKTVLYIEQAVAVFKSEQFYSSELFMKAYRIIKYAQELLSLLVYPQAISYGEFDSDFYKQSYSDLKEEVLNKDVNGFVEYFEQKVDELIGPDTKFVGISVAYNRQLLPALTLAKVLKEKKNVHVSLGGNFFSRITDTLQKTPEFFDIFADSITIGDGEQNIIKLIKAVNLDESLDDLEGVMYKGKDGVRFSESQVITNMQKIAKISLDGYDFGQYFAPEIVLPVQLSKGCYWGKCSFCDYFHGKPRFYTKTVSQAVEELKYYSERYGITKFEFVDEAISPHYFEKLADKILEQNLKINFYSMVRLESGFTKEVLEKLYKAGLRMLDWGYESSSTRIMELMNKGVDIEKREEILRLSSQAGIWNHLFIMFGFPTETKDDALQTVNFLQENEDIVDGYSCSIFALRKHSKIAKFLEEYNLSNKQDKDDFSIEFSFDEDKKTIRQKETLLEYFGEDYMKDKLINKLHFYLSENYLLLYLLKYGKSFVKYEKFS